ncbi:hypothetical protein C4D60_Mb03t02430 [Musa balbisiana]|uniref:Uncharacterized protein n=1 Tax=Musa balbisiana TaxID=52838 RepID=A0A4V4H5U0_MUSBA|nr:hypothetical protein C4D60_Mb03t02430 [Musa balbisiana]
MEQKKSTTACIGLPAVESMEEAESFQGLDGFELLRRRRRRQRVHFGHEGDDFRSMTRRWQFTQTNAIMLLLPLELHCFFVSELPKVEMLSSNFIDFSSILTQLFFIVFLFK